MIPEIFRKYREQACPQLYENQMLLLLLSHVHSQEKFIRGWVQELISESREWLHPTWPVACSSLSPISKLQAAPFTPHYTHSSNKITLNSAPTEQRSLMEKTTHLSQLSCLEQNRPASREEAVPPKPDPQEGGLSTCLFLVRRFSFQGLCLRFRHLWINWCGRVWWYIPILKKNKKQRFFSDYNWSAHSYRKIGNAQKFKKRRKIDTFHYYPDITLVMFLIHSWPFSLLMCVYDFKTKLEPVIEQNWDMQLNMHLHSYILFILT